MVEQYSKFALPDTETHVSKARFPVWFLSNYLTFFVKKVDVQVMLDKNMILLFAYLSETCFLLIHKALLMHLEMSCQFYQSDVYYDVILCFGNTQF